MQLCVLGTVLLLGLSIPHVFGFNQFLEGGFDEGELVDLIVDEPVDQEGTTPPKVVIERVVSYADNNGSDVVVLRNIGGQTQDLAGWQLIDSDKEGSDPLLFDDCEESLRILAPAQKLELTPTSEENTCGFSFQISFRDTITLVDAAGAVAESVSWEDSSIGTAFRRTGNGTYTVLDEGKDIITTLESLGNFKILLQALEAVGVRANLTAESDPEYSGVVLPEAPPPAPLEPQFPAWFGFTFNRSTLPAPPPPPPPPPPPEEGLPELGPYTVFAPTDDAFVTLLREISGPQNDLIPLNKLLERPEMEDIILYHLVVGGWTSDYLVNNTGIVTAKISELTPFTDGAMGEGSIMLLDTCVDRPTPDGITCLEQAEFGKCNDPVMTSPLGAQWHGGFCQRTCERCSCDPDHGTTCTQVLMADVIASNGVIHTINRVLLPPPIFEAVEKPEPPKKTKTKPKSTRTRTGASSGASTRTAGETTISRSTSSDPPAEPKKKSKDRMRTLSLRQGRGG